MLDVLYNPWFLPFSAIIVLSVVYSVTSFWHHRAKRAEAMIEVINLASSPDYYCYAFWSRDVEGAIRFVNTVALRTMFAPLGEHAPVGKTFEEIFGADVSAQISILDSKASNSLPRAKMALIRFPKLGNLYVIETVAVTHEGIPVFQGMAFPADALSTVPCLVS